MPSLYHISHFLRKQGVALCNQWRLVRFAITCYAIYF
jgi:hypothetical protein